MSFHALKSLLDLVFSVLVALDIFFQADLCYPVNGRKVPQLLDVRVVLVFLPMRTFIFQLSIYYILTLKTTLKGQIIGKITQTLSLSVHSSANLNEASEYQQTKKK
jgi:hypothetical protein